MIYKHVGKLPKNPTIVEIGAHTGTDTARIVSVAKPGQYIAFEPDERSLSELRGRQLPITVVPLAVSDATGEQPFWESSGSPVSGHRNVTDCSSLMEPKDNVQIRSWLRFQLASVQTIRLDDYCRKHEIDRVDFIWMDVQGAELKVINGGQETLVCTRLLYTECDERHELYHGAPRLEQIVSALPGMWCIKFQTLTDVLLENVDF